MAKYSPNECSLVKLKLAKWKNAEYYFVIIHRYQFESVYCHFSVWLDVFEHI